MQLLGLMMVKESIILENVHIVGMFIREERLPLSVSENYGVVIHVQNATGITILPSEEDNTVSGVLPYSKRSSG